MARVEGNAWLNWVGPFLRVPFYNADSKCQIHTKKYNVVYCATCQEDPKCELCWENHKALHQPHHIVLQVSICSGRTAIKGTAISKYLDVSDIQKYTINSKPVVFLNPNLAGQQKSHIILKCVTCQRQLIAKETQGANRFCSINCKKEYVEGNVDDEHRQQPMPSQPIPSQPTPSQTKKRTKSQVQKRRIEKHDEQIQKMIDDEKHDEQIQKMIERQKQIEKAIDCAMNICLPILERRMINDSRCHSLRKRSRKGIPHRAPLK